MNLHTGTVEEAAVATAAALANARVNRARSDGGGYSNAASPTSTPSPAAQRHPTASPQPSDFSFMDSSSLPGHMRGQFGMAQSHAMTTAPYASNVRPTSHPLNYGPPSVMEPSMKLESHGGSAGGSPHISSGWQSPAHMPLPSVNLGHTYAGPEYPPAPNMIYYAPGAGMRQQDVANGKYDYSFKPRNPDLWTTAM